jgi:hypothetical protein
MKPIELRHFVMSTALGMIFADKMDPAEVHKVLWPLDECRQGLPPDTPCPPGDTRFGKYANDSDPE